MLSSVFARVAPHPLAAWLPVRWLTEQQGKRPHSGYLVKRGEINKGWKVRWCVVEEGRMYYFRSPESSKPISYIPLGQTVIRICREDMGEDHCFEIITKSRIYYLVAKSHAEMLEWVDVLQSHTILHSENELIQQAEEAIARNTQRKALEEQRKYIAHYMKHRPVAAKRKSVQPIAMPVPQGQAPAPPTAASEAEETSDSTQPTANGGEQEADGTASRPFFSSKGSRAEGLRLPSIGSYRHLLTQATINGDTDSEKEENGIEDVEKEDVEKEDVEVEDVDVEEGKELEIKEAEESRPGEEVRTPANSDAVKAGQKVAPADAEAEAQVQAEPEAEREVQVAAPQAEAEPEAEVEAEEARDMQIGAGTGTDALGEEHPHEAMGARGAEEEESEEQLGEVRANEQGSLPPEDELSAETGELETANDGEASDHEDGVRAADEEGEEDHGVEVCGVAEDDCREETVEERCSGGDSR